MLYSYNKIKNFQFFLKVYFFEENLTNKKISPPNTSVAISNMGKLDGTSTIKIKVYVFLGFKGRSLLFSYFD